MDEHVPGWTKVVQLGGKLGLRSFQRFFIAYTTEEHSSSLLYCNASTHKSTPSCLRCMLASICIAWHCIAAMFGRSGAQLVRELNTDGGDIRRFNHDLFNKALGEVREHFHQVTTIMEKIQDESSEEQLTPADGNYIGALIHHQSLLRNKRCLLAYLYNRVQRIQRLRWQLGAILPEDIRDRLHPSEKEFVKNYSENLGSYMTKIDLDLTVDATPPKDPYIQVRVMDNIGEVLLGDQSTSLVRNSIHFVKRTEAESLISQGLVEEFTG